MPDGEKNEGQTIGGWDGYAAVAVAVAAQPQVTVEKIILDEVEAWYGVDPRVSAARIATEVGP